MASALIKQANEELLKCAICTRSFEAPKLLPCLHSFCQQCLVDSLERSEIPNGAAFLCPICKEECTVPRKGVGAMKTNVFLETLQEFTDRKTLVKKQACDGCEQGMPAQRKCIECDEWLCDPCCSAHRKVKVSRNHHLVSTADIKSGTYDELIKENFEPLICAKHGEPLKLFCTESCCQGPICTVCKTTAGHDGHKAIELGDQARQDLNQLQGLLPNLQDSIGASVSKINNIKMADKQASAARKDIHKTINSRMEEVCETIVKQIGDYAETLHQQVESMVKTHKQRLSSEHDEGKNKLRAMVGSQVISQNLMEFGRAEEVVAISREVIERVGQFQRPPRTVPPVWRQPRLNPPDIISTEQISHIFGTLTFEGELVRTTLVRTLSAKVANDLRAPSLSDVTVSLDNEIVVVDKDNQRVKVFSNEGQLLMASSSNQFKMPNRLAIAKNTGNILVKDESTVKILQKDGSIVGNFVANLKQPVGITVALDGSLILTDWITAAVHYFDEHAQETKAFLSQSEAPAYLTTDKAGSGNVILTDWKQHNVKAFDRDGKFLFRFGEPGKGTNQLDHPYGICTDAYGHIIVADTWNNRIVMLTPEGSFMKVLVSKSDGLQWPQAVATDQDGMLIVAEQHGNIKLFQYMA